MTKFKIKKSGWLVYWTYEFESDNDKSRCKEWTLDLILFRIHRAYYWQGGLITFRFLFFSFVYSWGAYAGYWFWMHYFPYQLRVQVNIKSIFIFCFGISKSTILDYKMVRRIYHMTLEQKKKLREVFNEILEEGGGKS